MMARAAPKKAVKKPVKKVVKKPVKKVVKKVVKKPVKKVVKKGEGGGLRSTVSKGSIVADTTEAVFDIGFLKPIFDNGLLITVWLAILAKFVLFY